MPTKKHPYYRKRPLKPGYLGSVMVAGDEIEVWRVKDLHSPQGDKLDGMYDPAHDRISLDAGLGAKAEKQTLLHELWHVIRDKYVLPLTEETDEALAGPIGNGFASALARWLPSGPLRPWGEEGP